MQAAGGGGLYNLLGLQGIRRGCGVGEGVGGAFRRLQPVCRAESIVLRLGRGEPSQKLPTPPNHTLPAAAEGCHPKHSWAR